MLLTKAKPAHSCDMGIGLILPVDVDAPFHALIDVLQGSAKASDISVTVRRGSVTWRLKQGQVWSRNRQLENILMKER